MPHNPDLVEHVLKEAGLFDSLKDRMLAPFRSREKKRAAARSGAHFDAKDKDWDRFVGNAKRKSFVAAIANDPRADSKLKMHVENMNRLKTGKVLGTVMGTEGSRTARRDGAQSYKIVKLRGSDRLGCTCRDWRFKKSVAQPGEQVDCKHIREFKQLNKTASSDPNIYITGHSGSGKSTLARKLSEERGLPILELDKTPEFRQFLEMQKQHYRSTGSLGLKKTKKEERAALKAALSNIRRPHIIEGSYFLANTDLLPSESEVHLVDRPARDILKQRVERTVAKDIARGRKADPDRPRKIGEELIRYYQPGVEHLRSRSGVKIAASRLREQFRVEEDGFRPTSAGEGGGRTRYKLMLGDKQIGFADFTQNSDHVANVHIDEKYRGLGLGRKAYGDLAALRGGSISTGHTTSEKARRMWDRMQGTKKHPPTMPHLSANEVGFQVRTGDLKFPREIDKTRASREFYTRTLPKGATPENLKATYARNARRIAAREEAAAKAEAAADARRAARQRAAKTRKLKMAAGAAVGTGALIAGGYALNRHRKKKTYGEVKKEAGHVEDRISERAPGSTYEVAKIRAAIPSMNLRKGQTYHVPLKGGKGYVVIGDVGKKHVVKTVLGPNMRPPGHRKMASSSALADQVGLQKGDVLLMTPKKSRKPLSLRDRAVGAAFSTISTGLQGSHAHAGIYVGDGQVVEARIQDGVKKRSLRSAMSGVDSMIAVRPKTKKKDRTGAAEFAKKRVGRDYDSIAFLAGQGASILIPEKMSKRLISRKQNPEDAEKFICGNLVSAAYASQGFAPKGAKNWDLTVPRDFLDPRTNKRVAVIGKQESSDAAVGRFAGQEKISKAPTHRKEILGDTEFYLDSEIPLITSLPTDPAELDAALRAHIGEAQSSRWSHPQIAIPASVDLSSLPGAKRTRFSVPLPGERPGTLSTRIGELHAHTQGPVQLVHLDAHNPLSGIRSMFGHIPETYGAVKKRFSSAMPDPFVKDAATRNYKKEYQDYHGKPEQIANRSMRNQARRKLGLKNGDPREVDHQTPLSKGGGNGKANLRAISRHANRTKFTDRS